MKTLYEKATDLRAHTWKDIGGISGLVLDAVFFVFLFIVSAFMLLAGFIALILDYVFSPLLSMMSMCRRPNAKNTDEAVLLEDGTLGTRPPAPPEVTKH